MTHLIEVAFGGNRKAFFQWTGDAPPSLRTPIIVEADRGEDLGYVHSTGELAEKRCHGCSHGCGTGPAPTERALRIASDDEVARASTLKDENESARRASHERARAAGLVMKISDAEWQWDRRKLTLYFTAEKRIDFRSLVRELAGQFRTRIELKQIGVRDEAKRLSGIGRCGREYCSSSWLPDLRPVNLGVAKDQRLSLNPTQISGACGRLMCCLRYEHEFYVQSRRRFPKEGRILRTSLGEEKVIVCDIFRDQVTLRSPEGDTRVVPLAKLREEVEASGGGPLSAASANAAASGDDVEAEMFADDAGVLVASAEIPAGIDTEANEASQIVVSTADFGDSIEADSAAETADASGAESAEAAESAESAPAAEEQTRRKRRRGRRGGRRLRDRTPESDRPADPNPPQNDS